MATTITIMDNVDKDELLASVEDVRNIANAGLDQIQIDNQPMRDDAVIQLILDGQLTDEDVTNVDEIALTELLLNKCGNVANYGEFVTSLRSDHDNPGFIDLGYIEEINGQLVKDLSFEIKFRIDDKTSDHTAIFGARIEPSEGNFSIQAGPNSDEMLISFLHDDCPRASVPIVEGEIYTAKINIQGCEVIGNGEQYLREYDNQEIQSSVFPDYKTIFLFAVNQGIYGVNEPTLNTGTKSIYDFKIYYGDVLVRHFKPYVNFRGVPCMYDVVNDKEYPATQGVLVAE